MIRIFFGENRIKANQEIKKILGEDYEIFEGSDLTPQQLPSLFLGNSLFTSKRKILVRDLALNKTTFDQLPNYLNTPHDVILFETKIDKRTNTFKLLKNKVEIREFSLQENPNLKIIFDIFRVAKIDGKKAVAMLDSIQENEDPIQFTGLLISQALKDFERKQGIKEKKVLKELSKLDLNLKSTSLEPWLLVKSFLLQLSSFC